MTAFALPMPQEFSVVSLFGAEPGRWRSLLSQFTRAELGCIPRTRAERNLLASRLDETINSADRPIVLLAEGAGCHAAAWWARLSPESYVSKVKGALFFRPEDVKDDSFASPRMRLPFPSILIGDESTSSDHLSALAAGWGSQIVIDEAPRPLLRRTAHAINRLTASVVERDIRMAQELLALRKS